MATFVGRQKELLELKAFCEFSGFILIHGMKGIGKSALVQRFCQGLDHILIDVRLGLDPIELLQRLDLEANECQKSVNEREKWSVNDFHSHLEDDEVFTKMTSAARKVEKALIVLDNAEILFTDARYSSVLTFVSKSQNTNVIVTSTICPLAKNESISELVLNPLSLTDSRDLLRSICPLMEDNCYVTKIIELCEGMPLALQIAGMELENAVLNPEELVFLLSNSRLKILSQEYYPDKDQIAPTYRKFLNNICEPLREALSVLNYIPWTFNKDEASSILGDTCENSNQTLLRCSQRHLISKSDVTNRYSIHGILRDCVNEFIKIKDLPSINPNNLIARYIVEDLHYLNVDKIILHKCS